MKESSDNKVKALNAILNGVSEAAQHSPDDMSVVLGLAFENMALQILDHSRDTDQLVFLQTIMNKAIVTALHKWHTQPKEGA